VCCATTREFGVTLGEIHGILHIPLPRQGIGPGPYVFGAVLGVLGEVAGGLVIEGVDEPVQQGGPAVEVVQTAVGGGAGAVVVLGVVEQSHQFRDQGGQPEYGGTGNRSKCGHLIFVRDRVSAGRHNHCCGKCAV
jgi:hypothetical protein